MDLVQAMLGKCLYYDPRNFSHQPTEQIALKREFFILLSQPQKGQSALNCQSKFKFCLGSEIHKNIARVALKFQNVFQQMIMIQETAEHKR